MAMCKFASAASGVDTPDNSGVRFLFVNHPHNMNSVKDLTSPPFCVFWMDRREKVCLKRVSTRVSVATLRAFSVDAPEASMGTPIWRGPQGHGRNRQGAVCRLDCRASSARNLIRQGMGTGMGMDGGLVAFSRS
uniref:Enoyl-CoA hydratase n=1 Tax=Panagrellus redivivus TaxID=6233 RepID=A0A7E4UTH5_PANRE